LARTIPMNAPASKPSRARVAPRVGLVLLGLLVGFLGGRFATSRGAPEPDDRAREPRVAPLPAPKPSSPAAVDEAWLVRIDRRLAALDDALRALEPTRTVAGADPALDPDAGDRLDELIDRLASLDAAMRAREEGADEPVGLNTLRERHPTIQWGALQALIDQWHVDPEEAQRSTRLLSDRDLLRRYGSPNALWSNAAGLHWFYRDGEDPLAGTFATEVYFRLEDGYVTMLGIVTP